MRKIYFDHNATTILNEEVREKMNSLPNLPYNASSTHSFGREARKIIDEARNRILNSVGIDKIDDWKLVFTSSGTEANNLLIHNFVNDHIIISSIEHSSIDKPVSDIENHHKIAVDNQGLIDLIHLEEILAKIKGRKLLSFIIAHNECGIIQDGAAIIKIAKKYDCIIHIDAVQGFGKISLDLCSLLVDIVTISAHKCGGPIGAACLIFKKTVELNSMIKGGGQEMGIRAGTENISAIYGFGLIAVLINEIIEKYKQVKILRDKLESDIVSFSNEIEIISIKQNRLNNTSMIITPNISNQSQLIAYDLANIAVSAGSACSSGKSKISKNLLAMGYNISEANCAIRVSLGIDNTSNHVEYFINEFKKIYNRSKNLN